MSRRFDKARRGRILAWTGAALAWGTAVTMAGLKPATAEATAPALATPASTASVVSASAVVAVPTSPARGLVILRYQPSVVSTPEVRTFYVHQKAPPANAAAAQSAAPAPQSSGS
jgi:hypothetical protein